VFEGVCRRARGGGALPLRMSRTLAVHVAPASCAQAQEIRLFEEEAAAKLADTEAKLKAQFSKEELRAIAKHDSYQRELKQVRPLLRADPKPLCEHARGKSLAPRRRREGVQGASCTKKLCVFTVSTSSDRIARTRN